MDIALRFAPETLSESLMISLVGVLVVMLTLTMLMYAIRGQSKLLELFAGRGRGKAADPAPPAAAPAPASAEVSGPPAVKLVNVDERTAAFLMAIVADETDIPLDELRFLSIKPL
ncbi:MAG: OadG family transporter subunit [Eubacteriales bacterium]|nr:OadG family transporter subunit [Eubacteriales bacterium]